MLINLRFGVPSYLINRKIISNLIEKFKLKNNFNINGILNYNQGDLNILFEHIYEYIYKYIGKFKISKKIKMSVNKDEFLALIVINDIIIESFILNESITNTIIVENMYDDNTNLIKENFIIIYSKKLTKMVNLLIS